MSVGNKTNIVAVLNQKGGVGKTTTVINLATYLSKMGRSVLVVDSDPQGNCTSGFGVDKNQVKLTLCDVLISDNVDINTAVLKTSFSSLDLISANARLASSELDLANVAGREFALKKVLAKVSQGYDYIFIDCPPALGLLTINALSAADYVLIPVQSEYYALEGLSQLLQVMKQVQSGYNPELELLGLAITMYDKRTSLSRQVQAELKKHFSEKLLDTLIPRNVRLAEAPSHGLPISEYDTWSKGAKAYKSLAREVDKRVYGGKK